jgi:HAD superfamily hydrolase (TIGR01490 family)
MQPDAAFFDMDFTLLAVDCELTWKNMLVDRGICAEQERALAQHYIELHDNGKTPRDEYLHFLLKDFVDRTVEELESLARENFEKNIRHEIYAEALKSVAQYRNQGIPTVLLSGSTRPIIEPIAQFFGITDVICTELEILAGRFTGHVDGLYRIQEHKVSAAIDWCHAHGTTPNRSAFYGDSMSDIPMFEIVGQPHVVNPNAALAAMASGRGWEILHWKIRTGSTAC